VVVSVDDGSLFPPSPPPSPTYHEQSFAPFPRSIYLPFFWRGTSEYPPSVVNLPDGRRFRVAFSGTADSFRSRGDAVKPRVGDARVRNPRR